LDHLRTLSLSWTKELSMGGHKGAIAFVLYREKQHTMIPARCRESGEIMIKPYNDGGFMANDYEKINYLFSF